MWTKENQKDKGGSHLMYDPENNAEYTREFQLFMENYCGEHLKALLVAEGEDRHHTLQVQ